MPKFPRGTSLMQFSFSLIEDLMEKLGRIKRNSISMYFLCVLGS